MNRSSIKARSRIATTAAENRNRQNRTRVGLARARYREDYAEHIEELNRPTAPPPTHVPSAQVSDIRIAILRAGPPPDIPVTAPIRNTGPKLGRNDPCWCGSGKKYKKCHLGKDPAP